MVHFLKFNVAAVNYGSGKEKRMITARHMAAIAFSISVAACSAVTLPSSATVAPSVTPCSSQLSVAAQKCRISNIKASHVADLKALQYERAAYNLTTFAAGLVGAAGLIYGAHIDLIAGAGIAAGAAQVLSTSGAPAQKQALLLQADRRLACAASRTDATQSSAETSVDDAVAAELLRDTVDTVEHNLLAQWINSTATLEFKTVLNNITANAKVTPAPAAGGAKEKLEANRKALATALAACALE